MLHREINTAMPVAVSGEGPYLIDSQGKRYIDASGGAAVSCLGHQHPRIVSAICKQANSLCFAHNSFFTSEPAEALAQSLSKSAPGDIEHVYFLSGGSEAIESSLKLARQYWVNKNQPQRTKFIGRKQSYHGNTLGALSVGNSIARRQPFKPLLTDAFAIEPCYAYRHQHALETETEYGLRAANELEKTILQEGAENIIGFVAETVGGATAGVLVPVSGYWPRIQQICKQYDILLILDEVMCGMGRTGSLFACAQEDLEPDLIAIGKGLGGGYQPIGAMLCSNKLFETLKTTSGALIGGHTYMGHSIACAAALEVQNVIAEDGLLDQVQSIGAEFGRRLREQFTDHQHIGDIRGRGLFWGIEFVKNRSSKEPFDPALKFNKALKRNAMEVGLICYPGGGTVDGLSGDHVLLAPPFIINSSHVNEIVDKLSQSIELSLKEINA